jgi:hypothetical protein
MRQNNEVHATEHNHNRTMHLSTHESSHMWLRDPVAVGTCKCAVVGSWTERSTRVVLTVLRKNPRLIDADNSSMLPKITAR